MIDLERISLTELENIINDVVLNMIDELENYQEFFTKYSKGFPKTQKDFREICKKGSCLLDKLGMRGITKGNLYNNSPRLNEYIQALKTLNNEAGQENIDTYVVKVAVRTIIKGTPKVKDILTEYYMLNGPESDKE